MSTRLEDLVRTWRAVSSTPARLAKRDHLVALFAALEPSELALAASYLAGEIPQGAIGIGWRLLAETARPPDRRLPLFDAIAAEAPEPRRSPTLIELDGEIETLRSITGAGSQKRRRVLLGRLFERLGRDERSFLSRLLLGELRQGALRALIIEALACALSIDADELRRSIMVAGSFPRVVRTVARDGEAALARFQITPLVPIEPMLASAAPSIEEALAALGPAAAEWKLDGVRVQVHRAGDTVRVFSRTLRDLTRSLPELVQLARELRSQSFVLDGEVMARYADGRPVAFQDLMRLVSRTASARPSRQATVVSIFFDLLHADGTALVELPYSDRRARLEDLVPSAHRVWQTAATDAGAVEQALADALAAGHEGLVLKSLAAPYRAGRRGGQWLKLKPAVTLDLVILAAEWGHGRRRGYLSNLHLGARDAARPGQFAMLGKTFKGLTDEMLAELTHDLQSIAARRDAHVVYVQPLRVVEVAFDTVQRSSRYDSGLALRFARVKRFRPDKTAAEASTIDEVRRHLPSGSG